MNTPIYTQIHDKIKADIEKGVWEMGGRLPSEREMAETFEVTRATIRQAIRSLCDEGILERRVGSGTYVVGSRVRELMRGTTSFTEIITAQGKQPSSKIISYIRVPANEVEREKLDLPKHSEIVKMERVRYADGQPICFEVACVPVEIIEGLKKEEVTHHFFSTLTLHGQKIDHSKQTISSKNAGQHLAAHLGIKVGAAILSLMQVSYLTDGRAFEYVLSSYVGERFEFYLER